MALSTRLPDPVYKRHFTGKSTHTSSNHGDFGPGFASVGVTSDQKTMVSRTNSQRVLAKAVAGQKWIIDIKYHPMTQLEFRPIDAFLQMKQGALTPFEVALPQYTTPVNTAWVANLTNSDGSINSGNPYVFNAQTTNTIPHLAGSTTLLVGSSGWSANHAATPDNIPTPGEMFTITDSSSSNHTKAYMITTVETNNAFNNTASGAANTIRLGISPPLAKTVSVNAIINFINPLFKVIMPTATRKYSLNTDNLYSFGLKLEEYL